MNIDLTEPTTNVISLTDARVKYRNNYCRHRPLIVSEELNTVECEDCGALLNPVAMLIRLAHEESMWKRNFDQMKELREELKNRQRCKCDHCGNMTNIRPRRK
ncbi:MAG: hypothetical protein PSU93_09440 [Methylobacter sp.]|uniref:Uncharacterized protein n=1 Tax=Candidatus Methylobacter titanis TaxID=3053457 RepID=A0AA43Q476_9GAMM|nr:hypothetical protein [Candidatus Methylobacter titanis]